MSDGGIDISGLSKAKLLAALYNGAQAQGKGFLEYDPKPMTEAEAQAILDSGQNSFGYLNGRVMKISLAGDTVSPWGYDHDNGQGRVAAIVGEVRQSGNPDAPAIHGEQRKRTALKAAEVREYLESETTVQDNGDGTIEILLGYSGVADVLGPKVAKDNPDLTVE